MLGLLYITAGISGRCERILSLKYIINNYMKKSKKKKLIIFIIWLLGSFLSFYFSSNDYLLGEPGNDWGFIKETDAYCLEKHGSNIDKREGCEDLRYIQERNKRNNTSSVLFLIFIVASPIGFLIYLGKIHLNKSKTTSK